MQSKISRLEYLRQAVLALNDDPALPWNAYPCVEWPFALDRQGYGTIGVVRQGQPAYNIRVHKYSLEIKLGPLAKGHGALHFCDNPPCFRPSHLWSGTQSQNMADMAAKGRARWRRSKPGNAGIRNHKAKLTWEQVHEIRHLYADGVSQPILAVRFEVDQTTMSGIICNRTWKDPAYTRPSLENRQKAETSYHSRFKWCEIEEIRRLSSLGVSMCKLAKMFLCGSGHIHAIVHWQIWKEPIERPTIVLSAPVILEAHTEAQWRELCEKYGHHCLCCGVTGVPLTKDHVIPPSMPGYSDSIDNIQPLCVPCNCRKGKRHATDYRTSLLGVILSS